MRRAVEEERRRCCGEAARVQTFGKAWPTVFANRQSRLRFVINVLTYCRPDSRYVKKGKEEGGRENTRSCKIGCEAKIALYQGRDRIWRVQSLNLTHNHPIGSDAREVKNGPLSAEQKETLRKQAEEGIAPFLLRDYMQRDVDETVTLNQIISAIQAAKRSYENGRPDVQVLLAQLESPGMFHKVLKPIKARKFLCVDNVCNVT